MKIRSWGWCALLGCFLILAAAMQSPGSVSQADEEQWLSLHRQEESQWAKTERLSPSTIHAIVQAAGLRPTDDFRIQNLDAHSLRSRHQVLLSTWESGTGKCLTASVLQKIGGGFRPIWSAASADDANFCAAAACGNAKARASLRGIVIEVPLGCGGHADESSSTTVAEVLCVRFLWDGKGYGLSESKKKIIEEQKYKSEAAHCSD